MYTQIVIIKGDDLEEHKWIFKFDADELKLFLSQYIYSTRTSKRHKFAIQHIYCYYRRDVPIEFRDANNFPYLPHNIAEEALEKFKSLITVGITR